MIIQIIIINLSRNLLTNITNEYIATCTYEPNRDPYCPVFLMSEMLLEAEPDPTERKKMLEKVKNLNLFKFHFLN